jgi:hypothetical protein
MSGDVHVRFCERPGVRFPRATHPVLVFAYEADARRVAEVLPKRLAKYGLQLHAEKTRLVPFGRPRADQRGGGKRAGTFGFLGFSHYWGPSRRGRPVVRRKTARDRMTRSLKAIRSWCRNHRHLPIKEQQRALGRKLDGHYAYYGITGNMAALGRFHYEVSRIWRTWLDQRSNRARMTWDRFNRLLQRSPLPSPRVVHSGYRTAASP